MTKQRKILIAALGELAVLILIFAVSYSRSAKKTEIEVNTDNSRKAPVQITTAQAVVRGIPAYIEGTGSFVADEITDVSPKVSGQVVSTSVNVGDFVQKGQVIARLDDKDAHLRLKQARTSENQAEIAVKQAAFYIITE